MADFSHRENERLSRRQVAERLVDLAYVLTTGGALDVSIRGEPASVAVPDHLTFARASGSEGDLVRVGLELSWSSGAERR